MEGQLILFIVNMGVQISEVLDSELVRVHCTMNITGLLL